MSTKTLDATLPLRENLIVPHDLRVIDRANLGAGYLLPADAVENLREAAHSDVGQTK